MKKFTTRWSLRLVLGIGLTLLPYAVRAESEPRPLNEPARTSEPAPLDSTESVDATPVAPPVARTPAVAAPVAPTGPASEAATEKAPPADSILNKTLATEVIRERNPNGTVKIERHVAQDGDGNYCNHGGWTQWDDRGQIVGTGEYVNGKRQGKWVRWYGPSESNSFASPIYKDFQPPFASEASFENGVLTGAWRVFDSKNRKMCEWNFQDGQRNGKSIWWYTTGQKRKEIEYVGNQLDGEVTEYQADGKVISRDRYVSGRKLVLQVEYYDSKKDSKEVQKKSEGWVLTTRDTTKHNYDWWTGTAVITVLGKEGEVEKHGMWTWWHANGQRQMEGRYEENQPVGKFTWWYPNGQKQLEGEYVAGRQAGKFLWWHMNGQKQCEGQYASGEQTGKWLRWSSEGKVVESGDYTADSHTEVVKAPSPVAPQPEAESSEATRIADRLNAEPKKLRRQ